MPDFRATAKLDVLRTRASLLSRTRQFFDRRGFIEVQTPLLSADTVVDRHLDPIPVLLPADPRSLGEGRPMWLQTSPEFAMKRLLASGAEAIYQITPAFRIGEVGDQHNPEFTMLEWYRRGDSMVAGIALLSEFVTELLDLDSGNVRTVRAAFQQLAGFDPFACEPKDLRRQCASAGLTWPESTSDDDWDTWFDLLFSSLVQPDLGRGGFEVIHDYPASQAALAQIREGEPPVAERFELFVDGVELANGYRELLDPAELVARSEMANAQRILDGKQALPVDNRLLAAMKSGLPPCVGVALGFDRLVMLAVGADNISEVLTFPADRA